MSRKNKKISDEPLIVGIGASAGGLKPLKKFFATLPDRTGMAFIVVVHLSPEHKSNLAELLQQETSLPVEQVTKETEIKQDCIYAIPPGKLLKVGDNHIELSESKDHRYSQNVIDQFFRSLGNAKKSNSVGIILSGTGNDGTVGLKTIKEQGGMIIVQQPSEAEYSGMPQSAINTGLADKILSVEEMAAELTKYKKSSATYREEEETESLSDTDEKIISKILARVRAETEHDFSHYKSSTVQRRIKRRMHVTHAKSFSDYLHIIKENREEADHLYKDLLITVTQFFRDPDSFEVLKDTIISELFEGKQSDDELRIWVPGCATGEEAYSIAMLLLEYSQQHDFPPKIQIFATDVDEDALKIARRGVYPESIAADILPKRLDRFFIKEGYEYMVKEELRNIILFARHNLLGSPPFSKLDLISCRNLLIYLDKDLQSEVFNIFHYALNAEGILFLGKSDSNLEGTDLFTTIDNKHRIYRRSSHAQSKGYSFNFPLQYNNNNRASFPQSWNVSSAHRKTNFEHLHERLIARDYGPPVLLLMKIMMSYMQRATFRTI